MRVRTRLRVVAAIKVAAIGFHGGEPSVWRQNFTCGEAFLVVRSGLEPRRQRFQFRFGHRTDDCLAEKLLPPALRPSIPYNNVRVSQFARCAEIENFVADAAGEHHGSVAEQAE